MLDKDSVESALIRRSVLYPAMDPFESSSSDAATAIARILRILSKMVPDPDFLYRWLSAASQMNDIAFYGSTVNGCNNPSDVDVVTFFSGPVFSHLSPKAVHTHNVNHYTADERSHGFFVYHTLLFPLPPASYVAEYIDKCRKTLANQPFFDGGIGEIITYSIYKALQGGECSFEPDEWSTLKGIKFRIKNRWDNYANMVSEPYTCHGVNEQIRMQVKQLGDEEQDVLTRAAIRRLRMKQEKRAEYQSRFIGELRAGRRRFSF